MKIKTLMSFAVLMIMSGTSAVQAQPFNRYINVQAGFADVDNMDNGVVGIVTYGHRVPEISKRFSIEGEFSTTVVDPERTGTEVSYYTIAGYGAYTPAISDDLNFRARAGIVFIDSSVSGSGTSSSDTELSAGFGFTGKMGKTSRWMAEYTMITSDVSHISVGLVFEI